MITFIIATRVNQNIKFGVVFVYFDCLENWAKELTISFYKLCRMSANKAY